MQSISAALLFMGALSSVPVHADTTIGSGTIAGTISTSGIATLTNIAIESGGQVVNATGTAVYNTLSGTIGALSNSGTISGNSNGVYNNSTIVTLNNTTIGTIYGGRYGINNYDNGTIFTLNNSGTISALSNAIQNTGIIATLSNSGTISGTYTSGITNMGTISTLINSDTISGGVAGIWNYTLITVLDNSGTINSGGTGVDNYTYIGTLINTGKIFGGSNGVYNIDTITTLNNSGLIAGDVDGVINYFANIGTLSNSGTIYGSGPNYNTSITAGIYNSGTITELDNSGTIYGSGTIYNGSSVYSGGITAGIYNSGTITSLSNAGLVAGGGYGIWSNNIGTLSNSGTVTGTSYGLYSTGPISTLRNSGTIAGGVAALDLVSGSALGSFSNTGLIAGNIINNSGTALTIDGGSGTRFGTLTGASGGISASAIGSIISSTDLLFNSGNQLLNDNISVNSGSGTVTNTAGVLQVNNQLTINGNYYQDAAATLAIGISSSAGTLGTITDTGYGRLIVSGDATVEAGSTIALKKLTTYRYAVGQRFVVIQASGAANYNAASLSYSGTVYTATGLEVDDSGYHDLVVTITGAANANIATTNNATAVLGGLFNYSGVNQSLLDVFNPAIALTDPDTASRAGAQLSPAAARNGVANASMAAFDAVQGAAAIRLDNLRTAQADGTGSSGVASGESSFDPALWGRIFGGQANQGERDGIAGYHAHYAGFLLGSDVQVRSDWRVGGLFSYAHTNIGDDGDNTGSGGAVDAYGLTAYAGYDGHPWYVNLSAGVARQLNHTTRSISYTGFSGIASGAFAGSLYSTAVQAGYPLPLGDVVLTPLAGLRYSALKQDGYTETGGSGAALAVNGSSFGSLKSEAGARLERSVLTSYGELKPFMQLSWNHEFRDTALTTSASFAADTTGSTAFTTQGASPLRNTAALSLGATLLRSKNLTLTARYKLEGASGYTAQTGDLTLRWQY